MEYKYYDAFRVNMEIWMYLLFLMVHAKHQH